eukprot:COSAG01_NODE_368_length_18064_cov_5.721959_4_plen_160_part_00
MHTIAVHNPVVPRFQSKRDTSNPAHCATIPNRIVLRHFAGTQWDSHRQHTAHNRQAIKVKLHSTIANLPAIQRLQTQVELRVDKQCCNGSIRSVRTSRCGKTIRGGSGAHALKEPRHEFRRAESATMYMYCKEVAGGPQLRIRAARQRQRCCYRVLPLF